MKEDRRKNFDKKDSFVVQFRWKEVAKKNLLGTIPEPSGNVGCILKQRKNKQTKNRPSPCPVSSNLILLLEIARMSFSDLIVQETSS